MLAADLGEKLKIFFETENNLFIVIAIAVAVIALIVIVAVSAPKKKKGGGAKADSADVAENNPRSEVPENPEDSASLKTDGNAMIVVEKKSEEPKPTDENQIKETLTADKIAESDRFDSDKIQNADSTKRVGSVKGTAAKTTAENDGKAAKPSAAKRAKSPSPKQENAEFEETAADGLSAAYAENEDTEPDMSGAEEKEGRPGTVEIYKDVRGEFHFRFRSVNGSIVGHSQSYQSKESCKNGIRSVIANAENAIIADLTVKNQEYVQTIGRAAFEIYKDSAEMFRFRLVAKNATNILASQGYTAKANCFNGAEAIARIAKNHFTLDATRMKKKKNDD